MREFGVPEFSGVLFVARTGGLLLLSSRAEV